MCRFRWLADRGSRAPATRDEGYVALQAWLVGQLDPRTPHAADLFAQDSECLYDAFLSVLIGTGLGFIDYDDIRFHHGLARLLGHFGHDTFLGHRLEAPGIDHDEGAIADTALAVMAVPCQARQIGDERVARAGHAIE